MAEHDPIHPDDELNLSDASGSSYAQEPPEVEDDAPRRAASARFIVDSEVGAEAAMRDAMDPANQSLADALRLSFRVLQSVILVLVVLFLVSGFQTVDEGQTGVRTVWGKIVAVDGSGSEALEKGLKFSPYPYPIGEYVLFRDENRAVDLGNAFAPAKRGMTHQQMLERADINAAIFPGVDGSLLTRDGDLAHLEISALYAVEQAGAFVRRVSDSDASRNADRLVRLALQRTAIRVAAASSVQEMVEQAEDIRSRIQQGAQQVLDELNCGIHLTQVQLQRTYAPLAIEKALGDLQAARVTAAESIERARKRANETLTNAAGKDHAQLAHLIEQYEDAHERQQIERTDELLASIYEKLDDNDGNVSQIIQSAKAYQSQIESTLGNEYRRFASLLPAYRKNPRLFVRQQWMETYALVVSRPDAELIHVPDPLMGMNLSLNGSAVIQEYRRRVELERRQQAADAEGYDPTRPYILRGSDIKLDGPGRMLDPKARPFSSP